MHIKINSFLKELYDANKGIKKIQRYTCNCLDPKQKNTLYQPRVYLEALQHIPQYSTVLSDQQLCAWVLICFFL